VIKYHLKQQHDGFGLNIASLGSQKQESTVATRAKRKQSALRAFGQALHAGPRFLGRDEWG
jgi:hypothetical protein